MNSYLSVASINTFSEQSVGPSLNALTGGGAPSSAAWPAANDAIFIPIAISQKIVTKQLFFINGSVASGNLDIGLYTQDGYRLVSSGSSLQTGTNAPQRIAISEISLSPGRYYMAAALDNGVGTVFRSNLTTLRLQEIGIAKMETAFPLPTIATFATVTSGLLPTMGLTIKGIY